MKTIQIISVLLVTEAAVLCDLYNGRIPNSLIIAGSGLGIIYQYMNAGTAGIVIYFGGILMPVLLMGSLYYFRMIGAGDIKLLSVLGGFIGPAACINCIVWSVAAGGIMAAALMLYRGNFYRRMCYFADFIREYRNTGIWKSYMDGTEEDAGFCFSIPVLLSILWYIRGGII